MSGKFDVIVFDDDEAGFTCYKEMVAAKDYTKTCTFGEKTFVYANIDSFNYGL